MPALLRQLAAATTFLTRVPLGRRVAVGAGDIARGAWAFPLVGAGAGLVAGGVVDGLEHVVPPLLAAALGVAVGALVTGAMHHDGLADAADALGGWSRERSLEIMRDHAVGAYGTLALVLVVLVDVAALGSLAGEADVAVLAAAAFASARAAMLPLALVLPSARPGSGQGRVLDGMGRARAAAGLALAAAVVLAAGVDAFWGMLAVGLTTLACGLFCRRWLGGLTGDLLGATAKLGESAFLVVVVAVRR